MSKKICVYCSSSNAIEQKYFTVAEQIGEALAKHGAILVYGGGNVGLMGTVARSVQANGGKVIGIIPERLVEREVVYRNCNELIITKTMRERKALMDEMSDAFLTLAGGFGTLDEVMEAITIRQLGFHQKPIVFLNTDGFYNHLLAFFEQLYAQGFAGRHMTKHYQVAASVVEAIHLVMLQESTA